MKKIYATLKNNQHVTLFDDAEADGIKDIYKVPNVTLAIPFEVDTRSLSEGEWYYVVPTEEQKEEMLGEYVSPGGSVLVSPMVPEHYKEISAIYLVSDEEKLFTKISSRQVQKTQKYITFVEKEKPQIVEQDNSILITGEVDAYWNGTRLYFKRFSFIQSLFPGIKKIYKEFTETETNEFLSSPMFELKKEMSSDFISLRNRKRIASIVDAKIIDLKDTAVCGKYVEYAKSYNIDLEIEDDKIALIDNSDIGKVLGLFSEMYYTTEINQEKREIRSSRKLVIGQRKRAK